MDGDHGPYKSRVHLFWKSGHYVMALWPDHGVFHGFRDIMLRPMNNASRDNHGYFRDITEGDEPRCGWRNRSGSQSYASGGRRGALRAVLRPRHFSFFARETMRRSYTPIS